jgi:hypothetical protein
MAFLFCTFDHSIRNIGGLSTFFLNMAFHFVVFNHSFPTLVAFQFFVNMVVHFVAVTSHSQHWWPFILWPLTIHSQHCWPSDFSSIWMFILWP